MSNLTTATKYFGCQIEVNGQEHTMWGIVPDGVWYTDGRTNRVAKWGEWKPILKPLSEITDEDAVEVGKIYYGKEDSCWQQGKGIVRLLSKGLVYTSISMIEYATLIDFLRSRYYDIDNVLKP